MSIITLRLTSKDYIMNFPIKIINKVSSLFISTSNTSDTINIYLDQQYVENMEDKYAELLKQNELLRRENKSIKEDNFKLREQNELMKLGNYNLTRDNKNLREDIYNLRLKNLENNKTFIDKINQMEEDKRQLEKNIHELECIAEELKEKIPKTNLLPKVSEKDQHRQFMLDCVIPNQSNSEYIKTQENFIDEIIRSNEYIVHKDANLLITNKGKIFQKMICSLGGGYWRETYKYGYTDLNVKEMTIKIVGIIIGASICRTIACPGNSFLDSDNGKYTFGLTAFGKYNVN